VLADVLGRKNGRRSLFPPRGVVIFDAYEIIGLNQKSLINQGLDWLRPIFLTQKEAMKMSIRRFYEQRRKSAA
jgi:hypothetical protein